MEHVIAAFQQMGRHVRLKPAPDRIAAAERQYRLALDRRINPGPTVRTARSSNGSVAGRSRSDTRGGWRR